MYYNINTNRLSDVEQRNREQVENTRRKDRNERRVGAVSKRRKGEIGRIAPA